MESKLTEMLKTIEENGLSFGVEPSVPQSKFNPLSKEELNSVLNKYELDEIEEIKKNMIKYTGKVNDKILNQINTNKDINVELMKKLTGGDTIFVKKLESTKVVDLKEYLEGKHS